MSRLVADGTLELQDPSAGYYFEIREGGLDAHPSVRGEDVTIPGLSGRTPMNRVADVLPVTLYGIVLGASGGTGATSFRTRMDALRAIFDPTEDPFTLTAHAPLHGLDTGETATISVRFLRFVTHSFNDHHRLMDIECESVDSPPVWVVSGGS